MEMKYVVPDMAQSFGTLEFAGESEPVFERDKNNRRVLARRSYNLYSDVQVQAGEKKFKYEQKVKLVNPKLYGRGYAIGDMGHTDYVLVADDIVAVEEK
ncbi:YdcP family protein [Amedibacterium intestinale]|uniref:YdcP family protein n=1 Tax=Amedibacterium intestinale TaxID=2583452 RepID=UPI0022E172DB|nr:YdcP family protein [Amedibacterium intestinale]